jgi:soluble P-type ATPase
VNEPGQQPVAFKLEQNYPNPFNPTTTIRYSVATGGIVSLKVYNTLGQEVATLVNGNVAPGEHIATFDATKLSTGVYIYKLTSGNNVETRKMVLLK